MKFNVREEVLGKSMRAECNAVPVKGRPGMMVYYAGGQCLEGCPVKCKGHFTKATGLSDLILSWAAKGLIVETKN